MLTFILLFISLTHERRGEVINYIRRYLILPSRALNVEHECQRLPPSAPHVGSGWYLGIAENDIVSIHISSEMNEGIFIRLSYLNDTNIRAANCP